MSLLDDGEHVTDTGRDGPRCRPSTTTVPENAPSDQGEDAGTAKTALPGVSLIGLLHRLAAGDIRLAVTDTGRLRTNGPAGAITDEVRSAIRRHHDLLVWTVTSRQTGHVWTPCNRCGHAVLLNHALHIGRGSQVWPRCYLTPGCNGRHQPPTEGPS
jgi:hypothetical protein